MSYLRAIVASGECGTPRALALTTDAISLNPAHYTAWAVRRRCLASLKADLRLELQYVASVAATNTKNYQVWAHRREVVSLLGDGRGERAFTSSHLAEDPKNYHAWAHRQWAVKTFGLWEGEMDFTEEMLMGEGLAHAVAAAEWRRGGSLVLLRLQGLAPVPVRGRDRAQNRARDRGIVLRSS
jgi:protein farnesyltransferase/geranylgeranyltransferase type-1 subunit alpha